MDPGTFFAVFVGGGFLFVVFLFGLSVVIDWRMKKLPPPSQRETKSEIKK
jgi:hypothetical protein